MNFNRRKEWRERSNGVVVDQRVDLSGRTRDAKRSFNYAGRFKLDDEIRKEVSCWIDNTVSTIYIKKKDSPRLWWSLKRIQLKLGFSIFKRRSTLTSKYETWKVLTCTDSRLEHFTVDHKDQVWRKIFARDSIEKPFREREYHRSQRREGRVFAADSRDYRYTSPLVHIFLRFHAYSVNSTSWPHKSTTQWRVARESIFIVAKCIKLRYRQSLSYSCTRACTRARARLQSTFVARFPYVCACVCVCVRALRGVHALRPAYAQRVNVDGLNYGSLDKSDSD